MNSPDARAQQVLARHVLARFPITDLTFYSTAEWTGPYEVSADLNRQGCVDLGATVGENWDVFAVIQNFVNEVCLTRVY